MRKNVYENVFLKEGRIRLESVFGHRQKYSALSLSLSASRNMRMSKYDVDIAAECGYRVLNKGMEPKKALTRT